MSKKLPTITDVPLFKTNPQKQPKIAHFIIEKNSTSAKKLSENALTVLKKRYLTKDDQGNPLETPDQLFRRVAQAVAKAEKQYNLPEKETNLLEKNFYQIMISLDFIPNSPTLMNAGRADGQLSACFVLPVEDSLEGIFETVKHTALIHQSGGGTGFSFSRVRPKNSIVKTTKGLASGPVSFMTVFNAATETIKQGGKRRGANMGILRVDHPDILEFIGSKESGTKLNNFNISIAVTDQFMEAVEKKKDYPLIAPHNGEVVSKLSAEGVFDQIIQMAWKNGDPGVIFLDEINRFNPTPELGPIESTNPCGEQPLLAYESCNLGSINLAQMLTDDQKPQIDWDKLKTTIHLAVRFLDDVIDVNQFPLEKIAEITRGNRKIGLGIMGFADLLIQLAIPYNSEEAIKIAEKIMKFIDDQSREASEILTQEKGPFPNINQSIYKKNPLRNATRTTIAPTGTISIIAGCSSGIEPIFAVCFTHHVLDQEKLVDVNPLFEKIAKKRGFYSKELMAKIAEKGTIKGIKEIPEDIQKVFVAAHDISPEWHVKMQAAFQKYTNNAVSKTVNFPFDASIEDVKKVYLLAYQLGCKGITVYRDRSRETQVLTHGDATQNNPDPHPTPNPSHQSQALMPEIRPRPRPQMTVGTTEKIGTGCGSLYVTINSDQDGICEIFARMGKTGGCAAAQSEAVGRLVSLALRSGIEIDSILKQIRGIRCPSPLWQDGGLILSCPDAIAKTIERHLSRGRPIQLKIEEFAQIKPNNSQENQQTTSEKEMELSTSICPDCGSKLAYQEGCFVCKSCGYSKCG